jgi:hypothetical protein
LQGVVTTTSTQKGIANPWGVKERLEQILDKKILEKERIAHKWDKIGA